MTLRLLPRKPGAGGLGGKSETSPVAWRTEDGVMIGHDGQVWLYRALPQQALMWQDAAARDRAATRFHTMLIELGQTSKAPPLKGLSSVGSAYRQFHMVNLSWSQAWQPPDNSETPHLQKLWLRRVFSEFWVGGGLFAIGVRLWRSTAETRKGGWRAAASALLKEAARDMPNPATFAADRARVQPILARAGGRPLTEAEALRLESWWNGGRGSDAVMVLEPDGRGISTDMWPSGLEFSAVIGADRMVLDAERGMWLHDAFAHHEGCVALSVRGSLVPPKVARDQFRKAQRKALNRQAEQTASGDLEREENETLRASAERMESVFVNDGEPLIRDCSILFARESNPAVDTFADHLEQVWGIRSKVVEFRQKQALDEMLPCGKTTFDRAAPFAQDLTVGVLSRSGVGGFSEVGDAGGMWAGLTLPNMSPAWIDPLGAPKQDKPPSMAVAGEPGAGKTFLLQLLATQACYLGQTTVFVNPKPADSLDGFAAACGGETVRLSALEDNPGALDPFRFAAPQIAAQIALSHILTVFTELDEAEEVHLANGLRRGAAEGARCVGEALAHPKVPKAAAELINAQAEGSGLFALGVSPRPRAPLGLVSGGEGALTLIEFDRPLDLPSTVGPLSEHARDTRIAVAALRLVCRAALEQMFASGGGVLIIDEAHVFLSSAEGRQVLQRLGREGRSQRILPVLATQRIADVIAEGVDMESYLSRALVMQMTDRREADAALRLCGLTPTEERRQWLRQAGPIRGQRPSMALYRDLRGRCSGVLIGPVPEETQRLFSTNPLDRELADKHNGGRP